MNQSGSILIPTSIGHALVHSITLIFPAIMIVLKGDFEVSLVSLGKLGTIQFLCFGLTAFPAGYLVDRIGPRNVLTIYFFGISLSVVLISISHTFSGLAIGLGLLGLFSGLYHPAGLSLISNTHRVSRNMGIHGISGSLGLTLGPLIGGGIAGFMDWRAAYILLGVLALLGGTYSVLRLGKDVIIKNPHALSFKNTIRPVHNTVFVIAALWGFAHHGIFNFMPIYFSESIHGILNAVTRGGVLTAMVLMLGIFGQMIGGKLGEYFQRKNLLVWVVGLNIPFMLIMGFSQGWVMLIAAGLLGAVNFSYQPVLNSLIADITPRDNRGMVYGISSGLGFGIGSFAATAGGYIGEYFQIRYIFPSLTIVLLPAVLLALWISRRPIEPKPDA